MLIEIGFRPNSFFISNSSKYFSTSSPTHAPIPVTVNSRSNKSDRKYLHGFFNSRKKKLLKGSVDEGNRGLENRAPTPKCSDATEGDPDRPTKHRQALNPFKGVRAKKETTSSRASEKESFLGNSNSTSSSLAVEFPMILNVGSIYSSHVVVYLDP